MKRDSLEIGSSDFVSRQKKRAYRGLCYFAILSIISLTILFYLTSTRETLAALAHFDYRFFAFVLILVVVDLFLGSWRNHILVRKFSPGVSPWLCFRAQVANEFASAVTPGQGGGGPAWLYILHRGGISIASGMAVSIVVFLSTLFFFEAATFISITAVGRQFAESAVHYFIKYGFITCTVACLVILLTLCLPHLVSCLIAGVIRPLGHSNKIRLARLVERCQRFEAGIQEYHRLCLFFLRKNPILVLKTFLITAVYYLAKLNLAYFILLGMGIRKNYLSVLAILAILRFVLYFAPTPGGSGIGEISVAALMSPVIPLYLLPIYTVLYRFFTLYLPAAFGAGVLIKEFKTAST